MNSKETIFALASALGIAGVAVIRLSGDLSFEVASQLSGKKTITPRQAYFCAFKDKDELIDTGLLLYFPTPNSFTGEDVIEIHCHGSRAILDQFYQVFERLSLRPANAGEFSLRAVENGKMDLVQAEGLLDLVHAQTEAQRKQALRIQQGELSQKYEAWRQDMLNLLMYVEADIDFSEEVLPDHLNQMIQNRTQDLIESVGRDLNNPRGRYIRDGLTVALVGEPNVGKSTLFNRLIGREASIISSVPGTTRDIVEATLDVKGYQVSFADTAGLRETADEIEQEGVRRALEKAEHADIVIQVMTERVDLNPDSKTIVVLNKADILPLSAIDAFVISAKTGQGMEALWRDIERRILDLVSGQDSIGFTHARHHHFLTRAKEELEKSVKATQIDLRAEHLRWASEALGELVGFIQTDDVLGQIFSKFCIGK